MKTLTKKSTFKVSIVLVLAMLVNMIVCIAPAFAAMNDSTVIYASGFGDYTADGRPEGWIAPKYIGSNPEKTPEGSNITYVSDGENNNVIKINGAHDTAKDIIAFNKVIRSGKIHISFDGKHTQEKESNKNRYSRVVLFNDYNPGNYLSNNGKDEIKNYSGSDKNDFRGFAYGHHTTTLLHIPYQTDEFVTTTQKGGWGSKDVYSTKKVTTNEWYHIDMIIDMDNKSYDAWMDGVKLNDTPGKWTDGNQAKLTGFKGFTLLESEDGQFDNIVVTHYATNDNVQMILDSGKTTIGPDSADGKLLKVNFNDYLNTTFRDGDFEIKDSEGKTVTGVKVSATGNTNYGCTLDFSAAEGLKANTLYIVKLTGNINGTATNVSATGASAQFRTAPKKVDTTASDYRFYYADEDFDSFTDKNHLPLVFYRLSGLYDTSDTNYTEDYSKYLSKDVNTSKSFIPVSGVNGNGMKMENNADYLMYFFPRGVVTGNFTMELDLKYNNGDWMIGMLPAQNWMNTAIRDTNKVINNHRYINALIGMGNITSNEPTEQEKAIKAPNLAIYNSTEYAQSTMKDVNANVSTGLTIQNEQWAHIKLDFDMADGKVDITLTDADGKETKKADVSYGDWNKFGNGVEGLIFKKHKSLTNGAEDKSAYLDIDNLKVYTTSGKLLAQDFNGYTATSKTRFPYFWISKEIMELKNINSALSAARNASTQKPTDLHNAYSASGIDGTNDNDVVFEGTNTPLWYTTQFANRVPAGQSYAVEFDLKANADTDSWSIGPVDATRTSSLIGYNSEYSDAKKYIVNANCIAGYNGKFYGYINSVENNIAAGTSTITNTNYYKELGNVVSTQWNHYKVVAVPQASLIKYIVTVNNGTPVEFTNKADIYKKDVCGIALTARGKISLDNVQAYICDSTGAEVTTARENAITDIKAVKADGSKVSVLGVNTIPYSTKKLEISFTEDLNETRKQDLTPVTLKKGEVTKTTTAIYNCIEDVIQLHAANREFPMKYSSEILGNKYIITLNDMIGVGETWSLHIAKNVNFASSPYSVLDKSYSMTFTGANDEDGYLLSDCQLVKKVGENYEAVTDLSDIQTNEQNLAVKLSGINTTGAEKKMRAIVAFYDDSESSANLVNLAMVDFDFGAVSTADNQVKELNITSLAEGKTYTCVKVFVWDSETLVPMMNLPISY